MVSSSPFVLALRRTSSSPSFIQVGSVELTEAVSLVRRVNVAKLSFTNDNKQMTELGKRGKPRSDKRSEHVKRPGAFLQHKPTAVIRSFSSPTSAFLIILSSMQFRTYASSASEAFADDLLLAGGATIVGMLSSSLSESAFFRSNSINEKTPVPLNLSSWPRP